MNKVDRTTLAASAVAAALGLVAVLAVAFDATGIVLLCAVALLVLLVLLELLSRRGQVAITKKVTRNARDIKRLDRLIVNVGKRSVTEARATQRSLKGAINSATRHLDKSGQEDVQDVEALLQLFGRIQPRLAMPSSGRWALEPTMLLRVVDLISRRPIRTILELGSGTSTLWCAYAMERRGTDGRIISLDHDPHFAAMTRSTLAAHGFDHGVEVRDAPLVPNVIDGHSTPWYDPKSFTDLADIDLLIVDGPPQATGDLARYPALPLLLDKLSPGAIIVVDDAGRDAEREMVDRWTEMVPGLQPMAEGGPGRQLFLVLERPR